MATYMEISMYLAIKQTAWYMEISVYFAMKHMARYMEISMYLSYGYTNKAYMKRSVYVTHKQAFPYSHCIINKLVAEVFIMRCNSPVSAHAYCGVDALRSWSIYFIALPERYSGTTASFRFCSLHSQPPPA